MQSLLDVLKPKTLAEDTFAYITDNKLLIAFGNTVVFKTCESTGYVGSYAIPTKALYGEGPDASIPVEASDVPALVPPVNGWNRLPLNIVDKEIFNAVSSAGGGQYWAGFAALEEGRFTVNVIGLLYAIQYSMAKVVEVPFMADLQWEAYYYLNQMFKGITAKKIGVMLYYSEEDRIWFTDEANSFYIVCYRRGVSANMHTHVVEALHLLNEKEDFAGSDTVSRKAVTDSGTPLEKHLTKPFKETITKTSSKRFMRYRDSFYTLYVSKLRDE